jgi:hypothetical protein
MTGIPAVEPDPKARRRDTVDAPYLLRVAARKIVHQGDPVPRADTIREATGRTGVPRGERCAEKHEGRSRDYEASECEERADAIPEEVLRSKAGERHAVSTSIGRHPTRRC